MPPPAAGSRSRCIPSAQLGGEKETIEQTQIGAIQMLRVSAGALGPIVDDINVVNMPFLFKNTAHARQDDGRADRPGPARQDHRQRQCQIWSRCAGWIPARAASTTPSTRSKPIDDLKGLKIRVIGNPIFIDMMNALGGNGIAMGYDQVFSALQTGVIDGAENNPPSYVFSNHYTAAKYYSLTEHLIIPEVLAFSKRAWTALSADDQALIKKFAREAQMEERELWNKYEQTGDGESQGRRLRDRRDRRQDAVPERGEAGVGQIRSEISGHDQAHPGDRVRAAILLSPECPEHGRTVSPRPMDYLYLAVRRWSAGVALVLISAIIPWAVFTRYVLNSAASWPEPLAILLTIVLTFIGAAAGYRLNLHMNISYFADKLPPLGRRLLDLLVQLLMALIALFMVIWGERLVEVTWHNTIADFPFLSVGVTYLPIPIGGVVPAALHHRTHLPRRAARSDRPLRSRPFE